MVVSDDFTRKLNYFKENVNLIVHYFNNLLDNFIYIGKYEGVYLFVLVNPNYPYEVFKYSYKKSGRIIRTPLEKAVTRNKQGSYYFYHYMRKIYLRDLETYNNVKSWYIKNNLDLSFINESVNLLLTEAKNEFKYLYSTVNNVDGLINKKYTIFDMEV